MITINNLSFSYSRKAKPAIAEATATIGPGIHLLAGENGAGKTTLLHLLAGVARPSKGEITVDGKNPASDRPSDKGSTFLLEENSAFPLKTVKKFAEAHSGFYPTFSNERFLKNLKAFGLSGDEPLKSLSLGTRKKAMLAYALALGVDFLMLDEPTNALDIQSKEILKSLIASNISDNQTLIVSTHTVSELENLYNGAIMMREGKILWAATDEDTTSKLAFIKGKNNLPDALYTESGLGFFNQIHAAEPDEMTKVDWRLLYSALHSPSADKILNLLTSSGKENDFKESIH